MSQPYRQLARARAATSDPSLVNCAVSLPSWPPTVRKPVSSKRLMDWEKSRKVHAAGLLQLGQGHGPLRRQASAASSESEVPEEAGARARPALSAGLPGKR